MKYPYSLISCLLCLLFLFFLFPETCFQGAYSGIYLWLNTIIPSLFPFLVVSNLMIQLKLLPYLTRIIAPFFQFFFRISKESTYPVLIGFLSGYPMGAKACADLVKEKQISVQEGQYLLSFVNNASPMFITSFLSIQCLNAPSLKYILYGIVLGSGITGGFVFRFFTNFSKKTTVIPKEISSKNSFSKMHPSSRVSCSFSEVLDNCIMNAFFVMCKIGGYIILFSIASTFLLLLPNSLGSLRILLIGATEITTGISCLCQKDFSFETKIVLTLIMTAFGGLSSIFQTQSVIAGSGLSIKTYTFTKLLQTFFAFLFSILLFIIIR